MMWTIQAVNQARASDPQYQAAQAEQSDIANAHLQPVLLAPLPAAASEVAANVARVGATDGVAASIAEAGALSALETAGLSLLGAAALAGIYEGYQQVKSSAEDYAQSIFTAGSGAVQSSAESSSDVLSRIYNPSRHSDTNYKNFLDYKANGGELTSIDDFVSSGFPEPGYAPTAQAGVFGGKSFSLPEVTSFNNITSAFGRTISPVTQRAAIIGQEAHKQIKLDRAGDYVPEQNLRLPDGTLVRKDGVGSDDDTRVLIIKPDTATARAAAPERSKLMQS